MSDQSNILHLSTQGEINYKLTRAIMVYEGDNRSGEAYATVHDVHLDAFGAATILAGTAVTPGMVADLARQLGRGSGGGYLTENVLAASASGIIWYLKPSTRHVRFSCSREANPIGTRAGITPHPGLIFYAGEREWRVFAYKGSKRPTPDTKLYQAPYFNVWEQGKICVGSVQLPDRFDVAAVEHYEAAWFDSIFTHPNQNKLTSYKGGDYQLWADLLDGKHKSFPTACMREVGKLQDLLKLL